MLRAVKAAASRPPCALSLPVGSPVEALLRPVATRPGATCAGDVRALTEWRNRFMGSFLSEFVATEARTERWLVESVGPDDSRILFMLDDLGGRTVGHMGLASIDWDRRWAEADSVTRGGEAPRGLVTSALHALWRWGQDALGLLELGVRVRSDNSALAFYEKAGFRELHRVPLRREQLGDEARWVEDASLAESEPSLVHMELPRNGG